MIPNLLRMMKILDISITMIMISTIMGTFKDDNDRDQNVTYNKETGILSTNAEKYEMKVSTGNRTPNRTAIIGQIV